MADIAKILVVEDEFTNAILLKRTLTKAGYSVVVAHNGMDALKHLEKEYFDAVLTDWMMPQIDGIELIRQIRENRRDKLPLIIMITALVSEGARTYALDAGADDYIAKPIEVDELLTRLKDGLDKQTQIIPSKVKNIVTKDTNILPPFVAVAIATSTGGPPTLIELFRGISANIGAAFFVVQHGPPWMLETFSQRLQKESQLVVNLAVTGLSIRPGNIYIAPGDMHLSVNAKNYQTILDDGPKENFVRPAADPLFRSVAEAFGRYSVGVILTGLGRDGTQGSLMISSVKGTILAQDPETAVASSMPTSVIDSGVVNRIAPLSEMAKAISESVFPLAASLKQKLK